MSERTVAKTLGWTSIAIGLTEVFATDWLQKQIGVEGHGKLIKGLGAREIAAGIGLLSADSEPAQTTGIWARVVGDVMDLALVGAAAKESKNLKGLSILSIAVMPVILADVYYAFKFQSQKGSVREQVDQAKQSVKEAVHTVRSRIQDYLPESAS